MLDLNPGSIQRAWEQAGMRAATTRAANGLARRAFTVAEVEAMQRKGIVHPDEKFELVEGEIVPLQSKSPVHELIKETICRQMVEHCPKDLWFGVERTIFLSDSTALDPDISLFRASDKLKKVDGKMLLLAIEVAQSSLAYDRGLKARLYARYGVPEYWVIDVKRRRTFVHTGPKEDGSWGSVVELEASEPLTHATMPGFRLALAEV